MKRTMVVDIFNCFSFFRENKEILCLILGFFFFFYLVFFAPAVYKTFLREIYENEIKKGSSVKSYSYNWNGIRIEFNENKRKRTLISCFGEISGSRVIERNMLYFISKTVHSNPGWVITCNNDIMLIHVPHGQRSILKFKI